MIVPPNRINATKVQSVGSTGNKDWQATENLERNTLLAASQFHGDYWNTRYGWSDRFRSTLFALNEQTRRWQKAEVINW